MPHLGMGVLPPFRAHTPPHLCRYFVYIRIAYL